MMVITNNNIEKLCKGISSNTLKMRIELQDKDIGREEEDTRNIM
jgi:hypothetical protein